MALPPRVLVLVLSLATGCADAGTVPGDTLLVHAAASLAGPLRALTDSMAGSGRLTVQVEHGGSLELARRVTEVGRIPDAMLLADEEVFPQLLMPGAASWYVRFARNRMVIAYTDRSRRAAQMSPGSWRRVLLADDVLVGRPDPEIAPAGYRALLTFALAERHYGEPGLAARLAARTPARLVRGNAADLAALLEAGELDYIVEYESLARVRGFLWVPLPPEIDLGDPARAAEYARATVRVRQGRDSVTRRGAPIMYAVSVPRGAPHPSVGTRFVARLLGTDGRALLRRHHIDMLERAEIVGDSVPPEVRAAVTP